jgi:hypothetical protein
MRHSPLLWALRRLLAAATVIGFLVGGPILLRWWGSPLPSRWPTWSRFVTDVRIGFVPASAAGKLAVGAAWALWAFLGYELLAETWSRLRRHVGRRASVLGPLQPVVSKLVAALLLSAPVAARSWPAGALPVPAAAHLAGTAAPRLAGRAIPISGAHRVATSSGGTAADAAQGLPTYVVQPRDTLWGIAQRLLGDPLRWSEIAGLNEGRLEGTGSFGDPHWIQPGWTLLLPADAAAAAPAPGPPASAAPEPGSTPGLASIAEPTSLAAPARPAAPAGPAIPAGSPGRSAQAPVRTEMHGGHRRGVPMTPIGYGLLAAGVIGMLDRMRRAQQRRRPRGLHIRLPDGELSSVERGLRVSADMALGSFVDSAMRLVAMRVAEGACEPPVVVAVRCHDDTVELVLDEAAGALAPIGPPPFRTDGHLWLLERQELSLLSAEELRRLAEVEAPSPGLVTLGGDREGIVLVDVERLGSLSVTGGDATMVLQGIVVELATLPWADGAEVVVVGHPGELRSLERVRRAPSIAGLLLEMQQRTGRQRQLAADAGTVGTIAARWHEGGDSWDPVVVVCLPAATDAEPEAAARLAALAGEGDSGVAVVAGGELATRWRASAEAGRITLTRSGEGAAVPTPGALSREHRLQPVPAALLDDVEALVAVAAAPAVEPPAPSRPPAGVGWARDGGDRDPPEAEVEVGVLGPVAVSGVDRPFARAWCTELVVYLALHPGGATTDQWATALWPDRVMAPASLHSTASATRRALGVSSSGEDHLPRSHGRLRLGPSVSTDWDRLQSLAARDDPEGWAEALRLVRGRPLEGLRGGDWAVLEGIVAAIEASVVDLAGRRAQWCLASDDPSGAELAARQGLRVSPYDERLYRVLLRAADLAGNPAGVEATMEELVQLVADEVEPWDAVHPETWDLYRALSRRPRFRSEVTGTDQAPSSLARAR